MILKNLIAMLSLLVILVVCTNPAVAYVSFKYTPAEYGPWTEEEQVLIHLRQSGTVGWDIGLQFPGGGINTYPDDGLVQTPYGQVVPGNVDGPWAVWTVYPGPEPAGPYFEEYAEFDTVGGYDTWVTIVPVLDKGWWIVRPPK